MSDSPAQGKQREHKEKGEMNKLIEVRDVDGPSLVRINRNNVHKKDDNYPHDEGGCRPIVHMNMRPLASHVKDIYRDA
jgi:hypothetical protein